jgi:hypothetical protein
MNLSKVMRQVKITFSEQDHVRALERLALLEKENKDLKDRLKYYNRLSRLKK